jgi:3-oxoacyl-[acyl-carrier protein] reductase
LPPAGAAVAVNYATNERRAAETVAAIRTGGGRAVAIQADLSRPSEVRRLFDESEEVLGKLDAVVANAATFVIRPLVESTEEDYEHIFSINAKGVFFTVQEAARRIRDGGHIVVTSTGGTRMFFDKLALYLGSKGAVEQFVRVLSRELGPRGITVNAVSPGFTDTGSLPERDRAVAAGMSPFARIGSTEEVAEPAIPLGH